MNNNTNSLEDQIKDLQLRITKLEKQEKKRKNIRIVKTIIIIIIVLIGALFLYKGYNYIKENYASLTEDLEETTKLKDTLKEESQTIIDKYLNKNKEEKKEED